MNKKRNLSLIITGPTGVGKTDFSIELANKLNAEIINIDMGQLYEPISIGTAKPDWKNETIEHHFFDIVEKPEDFTVFEYKKKVKNLLAKIWSKNKLPIFVGGSGFYIQSLLYPPQVEHNINNELKIINHGDLWQKLYEIDPKRAQQINKNDIYRLKRAIYIWQKTGQRPSENKPIYNPISDFILIILTREREELYKIINERVVKMIEQGWIDEVNNLSSQWKLFLKRKKIIGYDDILTFLESDYHNQDLLIETIQKKVRHYAKRQLTFFKTLSKKIIKSELSSNELSYAKKIVWINLSKSSHEFLKL